MYNTNKLEPATGKRPYSEIIAYSNPESQRRIYSSVFENGISPLSDRNVEQQSENKRTKYEGKNSIEKFVAFEVADALVCIIKLLSLHDVFYLSSTSRLLRGSILNLKFQINLRSNLSTIDNEKLEFSKKYNVNTKIEAKTNEDYQGLINFIKTPNNQCTLKYVEAIELGDVNKSNESKVKELLSLLGTKSDQLENLRSFKCGTIYSEVALNFPEYFNNLHSFECGNIHLNNVSVVSLFKNCPNLRFFKCGDINTTSNLTFCETHNHLYSFECGIMAINTSVSLPQNCPNLRFFKCGNIVQANFTFPETLNNLSSIELKGMVNTSLLLPKNCPKLELFKCGNLFGGGITFPETLENLDSLDFENFYSAVNLSLPKNCKNLHHLTYKHIQNPEVKKELDNLQEKIRNQTA